MRTKVETILGISGGFLGSVISVFIFYVTLINVWPGGMAMGYVVPEIFGYSDSFVIMLGIGTMTIVLGLMGIAGGVVAKTNRKKGGKLMLAAGVAGILLFSWMWIIQGILLISGGILAFRSSE
ncbi:MAG: DUF4064 domain-containing protein [Methanolobus sp.]|jgi:hypothetical protein|nr:DUF4064 domain-containing protein [Methanolobus sp.]